MAAPACEVEVLVTLPGREMRGVAVGQAASRLAPFPRWWERERERERRGGAAVVQRPKESPVKACGF